MKFILQFLQCVASYSITYYVFYIFVYISILVLFISRCCGQDGDAKVKSSVEREEPERSPGEGFCL